MLRGCGDVINLRTLVVSEGAVLVVDDLPLHLKAREITVFGDLIIGTESCPIYSKVTLELKGDKASTLSQGYDPHLSQITPHT